MRKDYVATVHEEVLEKCVKKGFDAEYHLFNPLRVPIAEIMRWLRDEHLLHIYAEYKCFCDGMKRNPKPYFYWVPFIKPLPHCKYQTPLNKVYFELDDFCDTYEKACEKAIEYAVDNLI